MDAFEQLVADLFWAEGYWVRTGIKVNLTREDKQRIGLPSCPRWEIDLVAYRPATSELLAVECKSYLDSRGVDAADFLPGAKLRRRYKLFHDPNLRETVLSRLHAQLVDEGLVETGSRPQLCLVYGNATRATPTVLEERFASEGWKLFGPPWINAGLKRLALAGYENSTASMVAKLLGKADGSPLAGPGRGSGSAKPPSATPADAR